MFKYRLFIPKLIVFLFILMLSVNYFFGYRYPINLSENFLYRNTFFPLLVLWILLIWICKLSSQFIFKIAGILFIFSLIYQILDKRVVAEILMTYCLLLVMTVVVIYLKEMVNDNKE